MTDDLEKLLSEVRKTISENKQFLEKLVDETVEDDSASDSEGDPEGAAGEEDFEEL